MKNITWVEVPAELKKILKKYVGNDNSNKTKKNRLACGAEIMNWIESEKDILEIERKDDWYNEPSSDEGLKVDGTEYLPF